ncbi:SENP2 protease, partial [Ceuthmochares aereus]|nr:SENP2 protease [Ceuthmochares aereus]
SPCNCLFQDMEREIKKTFGHGKPNDIISSAFGINITREDICTLKNGCWLNSDVVHFYMNLLRERSMKQGYPAVHAFDPFFYNMLITSDYAELEDWTTGIDLFKKDIILVPLILEEHWTLVVIDMRKKTIKYFDSVAEGGRQDICKTLLKYLQEESREKRHLELDCSEWTLYSM